jgi:hypothetical protein
MAEKYLKVIRDGVESYIPDNTANRTFWAKQNARLGRGRSSAHELATIVQATDVEVAFMTKPVAESLAANAAQVNSTDELKNMRSMLESQQTLINQLLLQNIKPQDKQNPESPAEDIQDDQLKERSKPGPKPKIKTDGKDDEAKGAEKNQCHLTTLRMTCGYLSVLSKRLCHLGSGKL